MRVLALVHADDAETGSIGEHLLARGAELVVSSVADGPPEPASLDAIVVFGSAASAYDDSLPWLGDELAYLASALAAHTPVLGICFGAQVLARALGGSVAKSPLPETGWTRVRSLDRALVPEGPWFEFHFDRLTAPDGAITVATTSRAVQAFTYGPHLGVQFHPEITSAMYGRWLERWRASGDDAALLASGVDVEAIAASFAEREAFSLEAGPRLFEAFVERAARVGRTRALAGGGR